jgi:hypothetical protein
MNLGYYMDLEGRSHGATLILPANEQEQPLIELTGQGGDVARARYNASSVLDTARRGSGIRVCNGFGDHHGEYTIAGHEVQRMARAIEGAVHGSVGRFSTTWQPSHPGVPF